jgi:hypothetical protein
VLVIGNFSDQAEIYDMERSAGEKIIGNYEGLNLSDARLELRPFETAVIELV